MALSTKKNPFCLILLVSTLTLSACQISEHSGEKVVIAVGDRDMTEKEVRRSIRQIIVDMGITDQEAKTGIVHIINKVIEKSLIMEYGEEKGITITDEELDLTLKEIQKDYPEDTFNKLLLEKYIDFNEWREGIRQELLIEKIITEAVSDIPPITFNEIKAYFDSHREDFRHPQMVQLRQIVIRSREDAEMILELLGEGHKMDELAKKYSITPEAEEGGILDWISKGELDESIEKNIFSLPLGGISDILKSSYGYHIFEILSKRDQGLKDLPEVMKEIESILILQKKELFYGRWVKDLKDRFPVRIEKKIYTDWTMEG